MKKFAGVIAGLILANDGSAALAEEITAARNIRAGAILTASDLLTPDDRDTMRHAFDLIGLEAARAYYRGQKINAEDFHPPTLVKRNSIVQMEFEKGPMLIQAEGRALERGGLGDRIRVMNLLSKRTITAVVNGVDSVRTKQ